MSAKLGWAGFVVAVCLLVWSGTLHSQPETMPKFETKDLLPGETEETILKEKVDAFEKVYQQTVALNQVAGTASPADVLQAGSQLSLARAELAAAAGKPQQQVKHLQEALKFADDRVKNEENRREQAVSGGSDLLDAIVQRADVKLALLRAKQKQNSR